MNSVATNFLTNLGVITPQSPEISATEALRQSLKQNVYDVKYRKRNGLLTDMCITLKDGIAPHGGLPNRASVLPDGMLTVFCLLRDEYRTIDRTSIESMTPCDMTKATSKTTSNDQSPNVTMTSAQVEMLNVWVQNVVAANMVSTKKPYHYNIQITQNGTYLRATEKSTGLSIDLSK